MPMTEGKPGSEEGKAEAMTQPNDAPSDIETRAVKDENGFALLFDLWVNSKWVGSRRTVEQCELYLLWLTGSEVNATFGTPW